VPASQRSSSAGFYKVMALIFLLLGAVFLWTAVRQHSWYYGAFAAITILNGLMSMLKSYAVGER
jgi:Zn-dependent M16 (insulinase) family peptidase